MKRVLITGSRSWDDIITIRHALIAFDHPDGVTLVSGNCPEGADVMCERIAEALGWTVERHPAKWRDERGVYRKSAGFIRNREMALLGADVCLAFHRNNSKGTQHMINLCNKHGIPVVEYIYAAKVVG
jgi:hypothetical protein